MKTEEEIREVLSRLNPPEGISLADFAGNMTTYLVHQAFVDVLNWVLDTPSPTFEDILPTLFGNENAKDNQADASKEEASCQEEQWRSTRERN